MKVLATSLLFLAPFLVSPVVGAKLRAAVEDKTPVQEDLPEVSIVPKELRKLQNVVGHGGSPASSFMPLGLCEGDCDDDSDCGDGLKCFQRDAGEAVPGCNGGEKISAGTDFCINDSNIDTGGRAPIPQSTSRAGGKGLCQGDCDRDSDCRGNLVCYQRKRGDRAPPQCPNMNTNTQIDYCVDPNETAPTAPAPTAPAPTAPAPTAPAPTTPAQTSAPAPTAPAPTAPAPTAPAPTATAPTTDSYVQPRTYYGSGLGLCGGDCDRDSDCKDGLICYQREKGDKIPDQCYGSTNTQKDYCIDPNVVANVVGQRYEPSDPVPYTEPRRLKLYWEEGYEWQDETFEREWCMMRDFDGYPGRGKCWYGRDVLPCNPDHVYVAKCNDDRRQRWVFEYVNDSEAIIKVDGQDRCLHRSGVNIVLRPCNSGNRYQRFFAIRGGFDEYKFEISQKTATRYCLNQAHHPKPGEVLAMYPCSRARSPTHMTSWFEFY